MLGEQIEELAVVHVVQGLHVDAEGVRNARHVEAEALQELDKVHLLARERVVELGAAVVTLRPTTSLYQVVLAAAVALALVVHDGRALDSSVVGGHARIVAVVAAVAFVVVLPSST